MMARGSTRQAFGRGQGKSRSEREWDNMINGGSWYVYFADLTEDELRDVLLDCLDSKHRPTRRFARVLLVNR
jgi:hypothetical protein